MRDDKIVVFEAFARKAAERLEEKKKQRTQRLHVASIDMDIEIRALSDSELADCMEFSDKAIEVDKYTLYMASVTLQEAAGILVEGGTLQQHYKITDMFTSTERNALVSKVLELSGAVGDAGITVIKESDEVKNS